jgi:trk system potassium uptake protein
MDFLGPILALMRALGSPQTAVLAGFGGVILVGALALTLPWSHVSGKVSFLDALFTSTSAVCVTGLTVVDTAGDFTFIGQVIIVVLIQIGGLGVMTFAAVAYQMAGRRMSLQSQALIGDTFFQRNAATEFRSSFRTILVITLLTEGVGAVLLYFFLMRRTDDAPALFSSIFHSVSAFCNAGFSIRTDNLVAYRDSPGFLVVIMVLIVLGGLGYIVLHELWRFFVRKASRKGEHVVRAFSLHARVVLVVSLVLIVGGTAMIIILGVTPTETSWADKVLHAAFQSVSARTAGFNSCDVGKLPAASLSILIILMFIGGSPASCAGGVKTSTLAVWLAELKAGVRGEREVHLLDRRLSQDLLNRSHCLLALAVLWNTVGILLLMTTETWAQTRPLDIIFEQISAFGTVGLSTGVTPTLSPVGKLWVIATMYVGRLGPLTIALWMFPGRTVKIGYPKGSVMIG